MCDYSLEHVASRPAVVADRLITTSFNNTISRGFAAPEDVNVAICLRPGTEIAFDTEPRFEHPVTSVQTKASSKVARFRKINPETPYAHHDALEFADGSVVPIARLVPGQLGTVLQLPSVLVPERDRLAAASQQEVKAPLPVA